jgi:hypothetical protein
MRDKKAWIGQGAAGRLTLVKKTEIVYSITAIHHEKTGAPRYLIQVIFSPSRRTVTTSSADRHLRIRCGF